MENLNNLAQILADAAKLSGKLQAELDDLRTENELLQEENKEIRANAEKFREENTTLRGVNEKLLGEGDNLRTTIHGLQAEVTSIRKERDDLIAANQTFGSNLNQLMANLNKTINDSHEKFMAQINSLMRDEFQKFLAEYMKKADESQKNEETNLVVANEPEVVIVQSEPAKTEIVVANETEVLPATKENLTEPKMVYAEFYAEEARATEEIPVVTRLKNTVNADRLQLQQEGTRQ